MGHLNDAALPDNSSETIAIVGGGITGLFCAYVLARNHKPVHLFEASKRLGGRIRSVRLNSTNEECLPDWKPDEMEFYAEFGPMRIELDKQLLVKALLDHLAITVKRPDAAKEEECRPVSGAEVEASTAKKPDAAKGHAAAYLVPFPAYASPTMASDPKYNLRPEETGKSPLQLLKMAMLRVVARLRVKDEQSHFSLKHRELVARIAVAAATHEPEEPIFDDWMKNLKEEDYWNIQTTGSVDGTALYSMGFWNLLSDCLSHDALTKLRDLGTFYHLLPENPNAAEWLVWWLLGFAVSAQLQGVFGGMQCIVEKLEERIKANGNVRLYPDAKVDEVQLAEGAFRLVFHDTKCVAATQHAQTKYTRVILALPKSPTEKIVHRSKEAFSSEKEIFELLDSAFGFPMVKLFVVVKERWWEEANRANRYATRVPTRELHYWKGHTKDSRQGMIMLYTDRPASSFWANYIPAGEQTDADLWKGRPPHPSVKDRLLRKAVQYINENNDPPITPEDVVWYGIRDWGREPFGGANHAWRPERKYWVVMRRLADIGRLGDIAQPEARTPSLHVCGEAYSDYHGFMEGSLRSAVYVLHRILDPHSASLAWLDTKDLTVKKDYLESLRKWTSYLDLLEKCDGWPSYT